MTNIALIIFTTISAAIARTLADTSRSPALVTSPTLLCTTASR